MFLDFLNQARERTLGENKAVSNSIKDFLSELQDYFNKPNINSTLSKDSYYIDRFEKDMAILINKRTRESFSIPKNEFPKEVTDYDAIKIENNKYVIDHESMEKYKQNYYSKDFNM